MGPMVPGVIVVVGKLLPRQMHVFVIGFSTAFGGCGAAALPFAVGSLAESKGVQVLQPIVLGFLGTLMILWLALPRLNGK